MGLLTGGLTAQRFTVPAEPQPFGPDHLQKLADNSAGRQRIASSDGIETGWSAGGHILDTEFTQQKNVVDGILSFALRIDQQKLPADLLRAYYNVDLAALIAGNPSGKPSFRQKREAKESARERLEHEAKDGRFLKRKLIEVGWDQQRNEVLVGTKSVTQLDRLETLFKNTFGLSLEPITAGTLAHQHGNTDNVTPSPFIPGVSPGDIAWCLDEQNRNWLGSEFLLWLWFYTETTSDTIKLNDGSDVTIMLAKKLLLDCPRGQTGVDGFKHEGPTSLPEARRAIQAGKLPRRAGLTLVRHGMQYELTLDAETFAVSGARLPKPEAESEQERRFERVASVREMFATLDLLFGEFCTRRLGDGWGKELGEIQKWLWPI